jgi:hypothetical protein
MFEFFGAILIDGCFDIEIDFLVGFRYGHIHRFPSLPFMKSLIDFISVINSRSKA